ncbi:MAG: HAD-IIIA family hydrolase [Alphaproteobacteria bacterium]|nr:HAD-IIIA family hydrolase [Alphaproteobacteria bacterium]
MTEKLNAHEAELRLGQIKLLSLDVDGVMTDGGLYYNEDGLQFRKFNVKDGLGIKLAMKAGVEMCIISASKSKTTLPRARDLGIRHVRVGSEDKLADLRAIAAELGIDLHEAAHMGDDITDVELMRAVGMPIAVADAMGPALDAARYVTTRPGGAGAVREVCDMLIRARGG